VERGHLLQEIPASGTDRQLLDDYFSKSRRLRKNLVEDDGKICSRSSAFLNDELEKLSRESRTAEFISHAWRYEDKLRLPRGLCDSDKDEPELKEAEEGAADLSKFLGAGKFREPGFLTSKTATKKWQIEMQNMFYEICLGIKDQNIVHRDLSLENVLLVSNPEPECHAGGYDGKANDIWCLGKRNLSLSVLLSIKQELEKQHVREANVPVDGDSALSLAMACKKGHVGVVEALLARKAPERLRCSLVAKSPEDLRNSFSEAASESGYRDVRVIVKNGDVWEIAVLDEVGHIILRSRVRPNELGGAAESGWADRSHSRHEPVRPNG